MDRLAELLREGLCASELFLSARFGAVPDMVVGLVFEFVPLGLNTCGVVDDVIIGVGVPRCRILVLFLGRDYAWVPLSPPPPPSPTHTHTHTHTHAHTHTHTHTHARGSFDGVDYRRYRLVFGIDWALAYKATNGCNRLLAPPCCPRVNLSGC